jgi:Ulp1 family protease
MRASYVDRWLCDEAREKHKMEINVAEWDVVTTPPDVPRQSNGYDCGVFTCLFADCLARGLVRHLCDH